MQQYTGTVQTDQGAVDTAKLNLDLLPHRLADRWAGRAAPGRSRQLRPGLGSTTGLVVITQMQPISVLFSVPEDNIPDIIQRVTLRRNARPSRPMTAPTLKHLATGHLGTMDNQIDTTTGTLKLRAIFANPDELLYPNQFVNARLLVNTMQDTIRVPVPAVQRGEPGTFVYVINADNTVSARPIKVGPADGHFQAVLSGLNAGDRW